MAKTSVIGARLFLQGRDLSGDVGAISAIRASTALLDVTSIQDSAMVRIPGLRDGEITFNCFFNNAVAETHDYLASLPTTDVLALVLSSTTSGQPTWALTAKQVNYDWNRGADASLAGTVQLLGATGVPLEYGLLLTAKVTHASATDVPPPWPPMAERVAAAGTVERWVRASTNGTFTTAVFSMSFRRKAAGDYDTAP